MADKTISALTSATAPLAGTEVLPIVQNNTTVKATVENIATAILPSGTVNGVQYLNSSKIPTTSTNLTFTGVNLGIATVSPSVPLDITSNSSANSAKIRGRSSDNLSLMAFTSNNAATEYGMLFSYPNVVGIQATQAAGSIVFRSGGAIDNLTLDSAGTLTVNNSWFAIGSAGKGLYFPANGNVTWRCGAGSPEGAIPAVVGSLYTRTDGAANTTLYVKESGSGSTGWVAK